MPRLVDWKDTREEYVTQIKYFIFKKYFRSTEELLKTSTNHVRHDSQNSDDQSDSLLSTMYASIFYFHRILREYFSGVILRQHLLQFLLLDTCRFQTHNH